MTLSTFFTTRMSCCDGDSNMSSDIILTAIAQDFRAWFIPQHYYGYRPFVTTGEYNWP